MYACSAESAPVHLRARLLRGLALSRARRRRFRHHTGRHSRPDRHRHACRSGSWCHARHGGSCSSHACTVAIACHAPLLLGDLARLDPAPAPTAGRACPPPLAFARHRRGTAFADGAFLWLLGARTVPPRVCVTTSTSAASAPRSSDARERVISDVATLWRGWKWPGAVAAMVPPSVMLEACCTSASTSACTSACEERRSCRKAAHSSCSSRHAALCLWSSGLRLVSPRDSACVRCCVGAVEPLTQRHDRPHDRRCGP
eukprot:scaffold123743_cov57-Phaeocystis_antarctica.AAC.4